MNTPSCCPECGSRDVEQTDDFDLTVVDPDECRHDFECGEYGCPFQIIYHPTCARVMRAA